MGVVLLIAVGLYFLQAVEVLVLAGLGAAGVAATLRPVARRVPGPRGMGAVVSVAGAGLVVVGMVGVAVWLVVRPVREQMARWPEFRERLQGRVEGWGEMLGLGGDETWAAVGRAGEQGARAAAGWFGTGVDFLSWVGLAVVISGIGAMYLLSADHGKLLRPALRGVRVRNRRAVYGLWRDLDAGLRGWLVSLLVAMGSAGVMTYLGYTLAGLAFAPAVAMVATVGEVVPNVGPMAAFGVAMLIALTQGWGTVVWVVEVYVVVQTVQSYVVQPLAVKRMVRVPEVVTLLTVVAWGLALGPAGLVMATPLNLLVWGVYERFGVRRGRGR